MLLHQNAKYDEKDVIIGTNLDEGTFWILYSVEGLSKDTTSELTYDQYLQAVDLVNWDLTPQQASLRCLNICVCNFNSFTLHLSSVSLNNLKQGN